MAFQLPPLSYDFSALEPHIDAQTMELHHDKHHNTYVQKLNAAVEKHADLAAKSVDDLLRNINQVPEDIRTAVRNHGGGHSNHTMFWEIMAPKTGGTPDGNLGDAIKESFGDFAGFQQKFNDAGANLFGSGWVWLVQKSNKLEIITTPNQDSPLMQGIYPILGNDVWEHAYYLRYQNKRPDYLKAWWNVVNWQAVAKRFELSAKESKAA
jgi:superoxide dismutase, Fe-Mn family